MNEEIEKLYFGEIGMQKEPTTGSNPTDLELVSLVKQADSRAFASLLERYVSVLHSKAGRYSNIVGVDTEDLVQEGRLALYRAVNGYEPALGVQFRTYAIVCINNSMASAIKSHMKNLQQSTSVNLDAFDERRLHQQTKLHSQEKLVEDMFIDQELSDFWAQQIASLLSDFERQVLKLYLGGQSYQQIAQVLSTTTKSVDNALQRVRRKLRPER